jgi:pyruvate dehydrogenase kinase 2/3/4
MPRSLPYGMSQTSPVQKVKGWYEQSFRDILSVKQLETTEDEENFTRTLESILLRHSNVVPTIAQGVLMVKKEMASGGVSGAELIDECPFLQDFLDRFFLSRISIRMLISQQISLHHPKAGYIGTIALDLSPAVIAQQVIFIETLSIILLTLTSPSSLPPVC